METYIEILQLLDGAHEDWSPFVLKMVNDIKEDSGDYLVDRSNATHVGMLKARWLAADLNAMMGAVNFNSAVEHLFMSSLTAKLTGWANDLTDHFIKEATGKV